LVILTASLLAACGGSSTGTHIASTSSPSTAPSASAAATPALATPPFVIFTELIYMGFVGEDGISAQCYGCVLNGNGLQRSQIPGNDTGNPTPLPFMNDSADRAYYLDGDSIVKYVSFDGIQGGHSAATIPGGNTSHATFAVSPDDKRIAVSVLDYSTQPVRMRMYVEDLTDGANHVDIFDSSSVYEWPVGWHAGHLVVAVGAAYIRNDAPNPYEAISGYHIVDPNTGRRLATMGSLSCRVTGPLTAAGTACVDTAGVHAVDWSGAISTFGGGQSLTYGALSPDGTRIAACCAAAGQSITLVMRNGAVQSTRATGGFAVWIDANVLLSGNSAVGGPYATLNVSTAAVTPWNILMNFQAVFPSDLG
jgi:hypothetical protein